MRTPNCRGDLRSPIPNADSRNGDRPERRSFRLPEYDYAQPNAYFVTICTAQRRCLFGQVLDDTVQLNAIGRVVQEEWLETPRMRPAVSLDEHVVMPNHLHAIVVVVKEATPTGDRQADREAILPRSPLHRSGPSWGSLGAIIGGFKSAVTRRIKEMDARIAPIWQRSYYEHVIRNEKALDRVRSYIVSNPSNWAADRENPSAIARLTVTEPWQR